MIVHLKTFNYLVIHLPGHKMRGSLKAESGGGELIFIKIGGPNKMLLKIKSRKKVNLAPYYN